MNGSDDYNNRMVEAAHSRIDRLERLIRNSNNAPTIPSYDHTNFPQDATYGQIVKDYNDHSMWVYGEDDTWHQVGGGRIGAAGRISATYAIGGGSNPNLILPGGGTNTTALFYNFASTDKTTIAFGSGISWPPDNITPIKSLHCNPGDWFSPGSNGGMYTFNLGVHIATGGYPGVDVIINNPNELTPEGWMGTSNGGQFGWWGQVTHVVRSQLFCSPGESKSIYVYFHNNNAFDVYVGWIVLDCFFVPTLNADTFDNPLALNSNSFSSDI